MARSQGMSYMRGRRMRATRVDNVGRPIYGDNNAVVTKGFVTVGYTTLTEEGEAINISNAAGETCISDPAIPTFNGFTVEAEFCDVDFGLFELLTGQDLIFAADGTIVGLEEATDVDLTAVNFALEVWSGATSKGAVASAGSQGWYGYWLTPFLSGGVIGDIEIGNDGITFTVTGMATRSSNTWGKGPYLVELVAGVPGILRTALRTQAHRRIQNVEVAPPEALSGTIPVLNPADPALTDFTATIAGRQVTFAPVPAGTAPVWYDFGDGKWDYAPTGGFVYTYTNAGTYSVKARRGTSTITKNVTVV